MNNKKVVSMLLVVSIYLISTGISYALFSQNKKTQSPPVANPTISSKDGKIAFDTSLPKTEECPLNGAMYSKPQREWWEKHRPLGVMIENHKEARPQSGISSADVVYEAIAEGGITRFLAIFYCQDAGHVGPVRSARTYFLDFVSEYGESPLYTHVGGANTPGPADALGQISDYGWTAYNDMNQFSIGFPTFWRDYDRLGHTAATEHTMYSSTEKLWKFAASQRSLSNVDKDGVSWSEGFTPYDFKEDNALATRPKTQNMHLEFWSLNSDYFIDWVYDVASNSYKRKNGEEIYKDRNSNNQITAKNIAVLFMRESRANDGYENNQHLLYRTKGAGKASIFMDGKEVKGSWKKESRISKILIFDENDNPVKFNRGSIWFEILPTDGVLTVK